MRGGCRSGHEWCGVLWGQTGKRATNCFSFNSESGRRGSSARTLYATGLESSEETSSKSKPSKRSISGRNAIDPVANCGTKVYPLSDRWEEVPANGGVSCPSWADAECGRQWCHHKNEKAMLLGWVQHQVRRDPYSGQDCHGLVYQPAWPAGDSILQMALYRNDMPFVYKHQNETEENHKPSKPTRVKESRIVTDLFGADVNYAGGAAEGIFSAVYQDAGMVPDGTPCSLGSVWMLSFILQMCYNGSCVPLRTIRKRQASYCNCGGYGVSANSSDHSDLTHHRLH
ncbi:hypothetical protein Ciccas_007473 [Cichlidogyrus casuarinus]|uniref:Uncharacterized protein n=1 Tax=Cichlidogyrus casuarinus TaxID=1844966 RepID=A0ABD2Q2S4_9PLAT